MENEVAKTADLTGLLSSQLEETSGSNPLAEIVPQSWITSLGIAYGISDIVAKGDARPGEFVVGGKTAIGKTIQVVPLDFRLHAAHVKKETFTHEESCYHLSSDPRDLKDDVEWQEFVNREVPADCDLKSGSDLFIYIPDQTIFVTMFFKGSLAKFADPIYQAGRGGKLVELETEGYVFKKYNLFSINNRVTGKGLVSSQAGGIDKTVDMPEDMFKKFYGLFINPKQGIEKAAGEEERSR